MSGRERVAVDVRTGGGGGLGDPWTRDLAAVRDDVLDGLMTRDAAARDCGVVLDTSLEVDVAATKGLRSRGTA